MKDAPVPKIYTAMANIAKSISPIEKTHDNVHQKYQFRSIDDLYNAIQPLLAENRVFCTPEVLSEKREERETRSGGVSIFTVLQMRYTFYAEDGSSIQASVIGEGADSGDKSANKAMTAAQKYAFLQIFNIPTKEQKDSEFESPEVVQKPQGARQSSESDLHPKPMGLQKVKPDFNYKKPFGQADSKNKLLTELKDHDIVSAMDWVKKNKPITGIWKTFLEQSQAHLDHRWQSGKKEDPYPLDESQKEPSLNLEDENLWEESK